MKPIFTLLGLASLLASCTQPLHPELLSDHRHVPQQDVTVEIEKAVGAEGVTASIHFLTVGGFAIEVNGERILTPPFYSNPPLLRNLPFVSIHDNPDEVDKYFPNELKDRNATLDRRIKAIFVGHAHYDHLMDVPYLLEEYLKDATLFGSETAISIVSRKLGMSCSEFQSRGKIVEANTWHTVSDTLKAYAIPSSHAPHIAGHVFQGGTYDCSDTGRIRTAADWRKGQPYAYLFDFQAGGETVFRLYYQDTANDEDMGLIPKDILADRAVDVAIIVMAGSSNAKRHPAALIENVDASFYLVGHWEDFFGRSKDARFPNVSLGTDDLEFYHLLTKKLPDTQGGPRWVLPMPGDSVTVIAQ